MPVPAPLNYSAKTLKNFVGHDFGFSDPISVDQAKINAFADITGDHQWIHVDAAKAKELSPYGETVAHGFLTLSLLAAAVATAGVMPADANAVLNYGLEKIRFLAPVPSGRSVRASFKLASVEDKGSGRQVARLEAQLTAEGSDKPAIVGELIVMIIL